MMFVNEEDIPGISLEMAKIIVKYIKQHDNVPAQVVADIIQAGLEEWNQGTRDKMNQREMEMEDD